MKEWILENTNISKTKYESLINPKIVTIDGLSSDLTKVPLTNHPIINIDIFTLSPPSESKIKEYNIKTIQEGYIYKDIKFDILANKLPQLSETLYSAKRLAECFSISNQICEIIPNSYISIAMCKDIFHISNEKFLHAFVIIKHNKEEYILDGTMNIIMRKKDYIKLFDAKIISTISRKELINTSILFNQLNFLDEITILEYLCFPKETKKTAIKLLKQRKKKV